jgi:hypothetical protein
MKSIAHRWFAAVGGVRALRVAALFRRAGRRRTRLSPSSR